MFFLQKKKPAEPKPLQRGVGLTVASDVVDRADFKRYIDTMPEGSYAVLCIFNPTDDEEVADGLSASCMHYPSGRDQITYQGLYSYAADFLRRRAELD